MKAVRRWPIPASTHPEDCVSCAATVYWVAEFGGSARLLAVHGDGTKHGPCGVVVKTKVEQGGLF